MSAHTPGPWAIQGEFAEKHVTARGQVVSGVVATVNTGWVHPEQQAEQRANAKLIAAAPELLAVAEGLIELSKVGVINDLEWFGRIINGARAAIAKAKP